MEWRELADGSWGCSGHRLEYLQNGAGRWAWVLDSKVGLGVGDPVNPPFEIAQQFLREEHIERFENPFEAIR